MIETRFSLAPIVLFVYKRPEHTQRMLESLARNPEFGASPVYVFCDGAKRPEDEPTVAATRAIMKAFSHPQKTVVEQTVNRGLAASIISGVTRLCEEHGRVIVLEDDLVVSPHFLEYMNAALDRYAHDDQVMQIAGYMFGANLHLDADALFMPFTTSWGWATWHRAWQHFDADMKGWAGLERDRQLQRRFNLDGAYDYFTLLMGQRHGKVDSWAVRWYLSVFLRNGLTLYPKHTLVVNRGWDGSGIHCGWYDPYGASIRTDFAVRHYPEHVHLTPEWQEVAALIRRRTSGWPALWDRVVSAFRWNIG